MADSGIAATWSVTGDSNANAALTVTKAGIPGGRHYLTKFSVVARAAAIGVADALITIKRGSCHDGQYRRIHDLAKGNRIANT